MQTRRLRHAADGLDSGTREGRFRARKELDLGPEERRRAGWAVRCAQRGDQEAIRYLYLRYADNVYGYVRSILHDDHDAEDVTQQVFAKLMVSIQKYEQRGMPFSAWILRVGHNAAIDLVRSRRLVPCEEVRGTDTPLDERAHDCRRDFYEALEELPAEQRQVLVLRHVVGLAPGEIAEEMGRSEDSVHGLHHRGRRAMRRTLAAMQAAPMAATS